MNTPEIGLLTPVEVARALENIPSAPAVLSRLAAMFRSGPVSPGEIGRIVRFEPGLAAQVLRAHCERSNGQSERCFTLEDAMNSLGFASLRELVEEVARMQVFDHPLEVYNLEMDEFWRRSIATALGAELLAEITGEDADVSFTTGLLHNVGMLAVNDWAKRNMPELVFAHRSWPREYSSAEGAVLGFTHAEVGATLLDLWQFSSAVTEPIRNQHAPSCFGAHARRSCLLHAAKWLGTAVCSEAGVPRLPETRYLDALNLASYELVKLVVDVRIRLGSARNNVEFTAA
ncbi:MAG TPA: HDOD domain-containing protein [Opitutaceae bacterium]|nr:HDOD domain-containing protein [Opitutaceae bacterium]